MSAVKVTHGSANKYTVQGKRAKDALSRDEQDLYEVCSLSGVTMSPAVYRIILDLLRLNVSPVAIVQMLKSMVHSSAKSPRSSVSDAFSNQQSSSFNKGEDSTSSGSSGMTTVFSKTSGRIGVKASRPKLAGKTLQKT